MHNSQKGFGAVVLVLVAVGLIGLAGWYVWQRSDTDQSAQEDNAVSDAYTATQVEEESYRIPAVRLSIELTQRTSDLESQIDGESIFFTLEGFLAKANDAGYSYVDPDGKNSCERLAAVRLFEDAAAVRQHGTEITGELIDATGTPIEGRITLLEDGRYALVSGAHASCNDDSSFDGSELQMENMDTKRTVIVQ